MICRFCNIHPPIDNSHVVSKFLIKHIKRNSFSTYLLNSWSFRKVQDGIKGPYLCSNCDNVIFSSWENYFKKKVFDSRNSDLSKLSSEDSIKFILSILYRYTVHFVETSPTKTNIENNNRFKVLSYDSLNDIKLVNKKIFIYPWFFQPINESCKNIPGTNHFLNLAVHAESLPKEDGLPNAFLLVLPSMLFLITDSDLSLHKNNQLVNTSSIILDSKDNWSMCNNNMPQFLSVLINSHVGQSQAHQRSIALWKNILYKYDKFINPKKICYSCQVWDKDLLIWRDKNCSKKH